MLGSLIGGIGSIVGGLLGGDSSQRTKEKSKSKVRSKSTSRSTGNLGRMVRAAERNGFNPLTLLRAGGLSAYSTVTNDSYSVTKSKSKGKNNTSSSAPLGAGIAGAFQSVGSAISEAAGSQQAQSAADAWQGLRTVSNPGYNKALEYDLIQAQLGGISSPGGVTADGGNPRYPASSTSYTAKPMLGLSGDGSDGRSRIPTYEQPTVTNPFPSGWGIKVDPTVPDAAAWEERYGGSELAETAAGVIVGASDVAANWDASVNHLVSHDWPAIKKRMSELTLPAPQGWDVLPNVLESVTQKDVERLQGYPPLAYAGRTYGRGTPVNTGFHGFTGEGTW